MKRTLLISLMMSIILSACASTGPTPQTVYSEPPVDVTPTPQPDITPTSNTITLNDNGKTIYFLHPGDSFLLNLGTDTYDWNVNIDNQSVLSLHLGASIIRGAQGIFDAQAPGTAILTADGTPKCFNSNPPCMMPSIIFTITVVVQ
ncbi:MAG: hypothetical protein HZB50_13150 [Chloroflexi bacterium]|nr:hypothetical protein [Chloroflexota bacterium]